MGKSQEDDPILNPSVDARVSIDLEKLLYGEEGEKEAWDIGFSSLKTDEARLAWMAIRLMQSTQQHCCLVISAFQTRSIDKIQNLAKQHGFNRCIVIDDMGQESFFFKT